MRESKFDIKDDSSNIYEDLVQSGQDVPQDSLFYHN